MVNDEWITSHASPVKILILNTTSLKAVNLRFFKDFDYLYLFSTKFIEHLLVFVCLTKPVIYSKIICSTGRHENSFTLLLNSFFLLISFFTLVAIDTNSDLRSITSFVNICYCMVILFHHIGFPDVHLRMLMSMTFHDSILNTMSLM